MFNRLFVFYALYTYSHWCSGYPTCPQTCSCYNRYRTMDCRESGLYTVPEVNNITSQLYLDDNQIRHLPHEAFFAAPHIYQISLQNNFLNTLDTRTFRGLTSLHQLDLSGNWISFIRNDMTSPSRADNLTTINLAYNKLEEIPSGMPHFAPHLRSLNMAYNVISSAHFDKNYTTLSVLEEIDLSGNILTEVLSQHLEALRNTSLATLNLISCGIVSIDDEVFSGFNYLKHLYLSGNNIPDGF